MSIKIKNHKLPVAAGVMIFFVALLLTLSYVFATPITTPGLNYAGGRDGGANFTAVLQATGSDETVCATAGTNAAVQQFDNFGLTLHPSAVIHGIQVQVLGSIASGSDTWTVYLRKNTSGAISSGYTGSVTNNNVCGSTQEIVTFGNLTGTFNQAWTASELDDDGFIVVLSLPSGAAGTRRINWVRVEVNYSLPTTTVTSTSTSTVTSTTTITLTSTFNTTSTYNVTSTVTSTTTLTNTFNTTVTYNSTSTVTNTFNTTITTTLTSTVNVTSTINYTTTTTITNTNTTTITVASCLACSGGGDGGSITIAVIIVLIIFVALIVVSKRR